MWGTMASTRAWLWQATVATPVARPAALHGLDGLGYAAFHVACLGILLVPPTAGDLLAGALLFCIASFGVSVGWHRYLSHRAFETSRWFQLLLVMCGTLGGMKGALWFAQHHLEHHRRSDQPEDIHSPVARGFAYSHSLWFLTRRHRDTDLARVARWARFPELVWINAHTWLLSALAGLAIFATLGWSGLFWSYFLPTVLVWHTFHAVGSVCHSRLLGYRRFATPDNSFNNPVIGLLGFGDGWHNNHHHVPYSAKVGLAWWEPDPGWWLIWCFERLGLVWRVRRPRPGEADPRSELAGRRVARFRHWLAGLRASIRDNLAGGGLDAGTVARIDARLRAFEASALAAFRRHPLRLRALLAELRGDLNAMLADAPELAAATDRLLRARAAASRLRHLHLAASEGEGLS